MIAIDGNNSLSRMAPLGNREAGDVRTFASDYFLPESYVDQFADVTAPSRPLPDVEGQPTASAGCTDNWKAAADDAKKKSWGIFDETGIFACACRHGMLLWVVDMKRSGELYV